MRNPMKKIWHDKRGNTIIIVAAALPLLIGSAGLATDTIQWALWKRQLQRAADSAAIAGVYDRAGSTGSTTGVPAAVNKDLTLNQCTANALKIPVLRVEISVYRGDESAARTLQEQVDRATQRGGG